LDKGMQQNADKSRERGSTTPQAGFSPAVI